MITRDEVLEHHSPAVWCLVAIGMVFTVELVGVAVWNAWERREQLLDLAVRRLHR